MGARPWQSVLSEQAQAGWGTAVWPALPLPCCSPSLSSGSAMEAVLGRWRGWWSFSTRRSPLPLLAEWRSLLASCRPVEVPWEILQPGTLL